jgi:hypothetical protein
MRILASIPCSTPGTISSKKRGFSIVKTAAIVLLLLIPSLALTLWLTDPPRRRDFAVDVAGVVNPQFTAASDAHLDSEEMVIGVAAFGEARAFLRNSMVARPERHLIHDVFGGVKVTITHCDISGFTRVFRETPGHDLLELRCGGLTPVGRFGSKKEMALMVGDRRLPHSSKEIPFDELPFVETTWGEWRKAHPNSPVFIRAPTSSPSINSPDKT